MVFHRKWSQGAQATRGYIDETEHVNVPAFWSQLIGPVQFHHGHASVSDKKVSLDGWNRSANLPPEMTKPFDHSLLDVQDQIPDQNGRQELRHLNPLITPFGLCLPSCPAHLPSQRVLRSNVQQQTQ